MESRVVPAISVTMVRSSPTNAFISEDFPAFGRPTTAKRGKSSSISSLLSGLKKVSNLSRKSPVPSPFMAEII